MSPGVTRALLKAATYKTITTAFGICLALAITGNLRAALSVGFVDFIVRTAIYVAHERAWSRIPYGRGE